MLKVFVTAVVKSVIVALLPAVTVSSHKPLQHLKSETERLIDYLSPRTVVNQSNASDNNCLPESDTRPLLHTSTPKQQTPSSTDTLTPTIVPHFIKTGHKTQSTTFTELDKTETAKKDFKKRWNQN